jgi:hypothetical protein
MGPESTCEAPTCNAPIWWGITELGNKRMPLDPEPTRDGNVIRVTRPDGTIRLRVLSGADLPWQGDNVTHAVGPYVPHHRTCKNPDAFRTATRRGTPNATDRYRCTRCRQPMNRRLTDLENTNTHPCCDPPATAPAHRPAAAGAPEGQETLL